MKKRRFFPPKISENRENNIDQYSVGESAEF
jgi:hypothetical protein